jgi:hypothetical protein
MDVLQHSIAKVDFQPKSFDFSLHQYAQNGSGANQPV